MTNSFDPVWLRRLTIGPASAVPLWKRALSARIGEPVEDTGDPLDHLGAAPDPAAEYDDDPPDDEGAEDDPREAIAGASWDTALCAECEPQDAMGTDAMFMCPGPGCECSDDGSECCCIRVDWQKLETTCQGCQAVMRGACAECGEFFAIRSAS